MDLKELSNVPSVWDWMEITPNLEIKIFKLEPLLQKNGTLKYKVSFVSHKNASRRRVMRIAELVKKESNIYMFKYKGHNIIVKVEY